jgi:peptidoglycan/xylan/chitin deacetylase (PgdA/CDA1 family)
MTTFDPSVAPPDGPPAPETTPDTTEGSGPSADGVPGQDRDGADADARRAELRRTYRRRRVAAMAVVLVLVAVIAVPTYLVLGRPADRALRTSAATPARSTTTTTTPTTVAPTTAPPTTVAPTTVPVVNAPAVAPVPGITVGPLTEGPGPIPVVHRIPTTDPVVFITIDDGATADQGALDVLRKGSIPTTLFLTQRFVTTNADYFRSLQATGATVQSHSITHQSLRGKDEATQRQEICGPSAQYTQLFGAAPELFRPPYGNWDDTTIRVAASCGMRAVVHWSATYDSGQLATVGGPLRAGDIILLHFKPGLGWNLAGLLNQITAAGLRPAPLLDYIRSAPPAPVPAAPAPGTPATTMAPLPAEPSPLSPAAPPAG